MKNSQDLTQGNISSQLIRMAIPLIATSFIQTAYSLIDMIWIGKLGSHAVAAVGTASFLINMAISISTLIVTGTGIKIAHSFGGADYEAIKKYIVNGIMMIFTLAILYSASVYLYRFEVIHFFNIEDAWIKSHAVKYLTISLIGVPFMFMNMLSTSILNSFGNSKTSFKINAAGLMANVILDPILIFGVGGYLKFGVSGAAYASVIGRLLVFILYYFYQKKSETYKNLQFKLDFEKLKEVVKIGYPNTIQRVSFVGIAMIMARLIVGFGATGIAVQKIGLQIEAVSYMTIGGLYGAVSVFVGQNYGKGNIERIRLGYKKALLISGSFGLMMTVVFIVFARPIFSLFVEESETINQGIEYLRIIGLSQIFMCIEIVSMASFNGLGKTHIPAIVSLTFTSLRIPLALILARNLGLGLNGVWWSISGTSMVKGALLVVLFLSYLYNYDKKKVETGGIRNA